MQRAKRLVAATAAVLALVAASQVRAADIPSGEAAKETAAKVRTALTKLPYYGVFDFLAFKVDGGTVTLQGYAHRPALKHEAEAMVKDLKSGEIDVGILWGPMAGFLVQRHASSSWRAVPFTPDREIRFDYEMSMGVRFGEKEWQGALNEWIGAHQAKVDQILTSFSVPLLDSSGKIIGDSP